MTAPVPPTLTRLRDWPERLHALLAARKDQPFAWGTHDCCTFAADAVHALTGLDPLGTLRGSYSTAAQAAHRLATLGGLQAVVTDRLGPPVRPVFAAVGDVLLIDNAGRELLAICNGACAVAPGPQGLMTIAAPAIVAAWRVA
mgnify:CR=1 FL=1|jgi:hypothetical protein